MDSTLQLGRPGSDEHIAYFGQYIDLVPDGDVLEILASQIDDSAAFFAGFSQDDAATRPAPDAWNILEIVGHISDTERVLAYRLLRIARFDPVLWESIEFEPYVENGGFNTRQLGDLVDEFLAVRAATIALLRGLGKDALGRRMPAEWSCRSVRALTYVIAGHEIHHVRSVRDEIVPILDRSGQDRR